MNKHSFFATLTANIFLSDDDFDFIFKSAKTHYDFKLKEAVNIGGFLYGLKNRRTKFFPDEIITDEYNRTVDLSNREIQLVLKSIEYRQEINAKEIYKRLLSILKEMTEKQNDINSKTI